MSTSVVVIHNDISAFAKIMSEEAMKIWIDGVKYTDTPETFVSTFQKVPTHELSLVAGDFDFAGDMLDKLHSEYNMGRGERCSPQVFPPAIRATVDPENTVVIYVNLRIKGCDKKYVSVEIRAVEKEGGDDVDAEKAEDSDDEAETFEIFELEVVAKVAKLVGGNFISD
jgi:hypothetical protein